MGRKKNKDRDLDKRKDRYSILVTCSDRSQYEFVAVRYEINQKGHLAVTEDSGKITIFSESLWDLVKVEVYPEEEDREEEEDKEEEDGEKDEQ